MKRKGLTLGVLLLLSGCAVGPDYQRPTIELPKHGDKLRGSGGQFLGAEAHHEISDTWWEAFGDPVLSRLIERALKENLNLQIARARIDEASAGLTQSRANLIPSLTASTNSTRFRSSKLGLEGLAKGGEAQPDRIYEQHQAGLTLSYQLDLFGQNRRAFEGAKARAYRSAYLAESARLTVAAQVARAYFALRALDAQVDIAQRTLSSREKALKLHEKRFKGGVTNELVFRQAEAEVAVSRAMLPNLLQKRVAAETALHRLLGSSPRELLETSIERGKAFEQLKLATMLPSNLPSDLLNRRPDVRAAESALISANAAIGQAKAAFFPMINLTGNLGSQSVELARLFSAPATLWTAVAGLVMPIFDAGKTAAGVRAANARQEIALAEYRDAVHQAFAEAHDYLSAHRYLSEQLSAQQAKVSAARRALHLAKLRYGNGYSSYLEVLDSERTLFAAELDAIQVKQAQLEGAVNVYLALGGGFLVEDEQK